MRNKAALVLLPVVLLNSGPTDLQPEAGTHGNTGDTGGLWVNGQLLVSPVSWRLTEIRTFVLVERNEINLKH